MQDLYIYVDKSNLNDCLKYGMKLSEYENKVLKSQTIDKRGINAYLSPKDSEKYADDSFECLRVVPNNLTVVVYNKLFENSEMLKNYVCNLETYTIGDFEVPEAIICSSILPENIFPYNKILDKPLIVQNSREFYYEKCINEIMDTEKISKYELYQTLLILGDQKKIYNVEKVDNIKFYRDKISGKTYTKRSN